MGDFPDILGMELHDAAALLEAEGLTFVIAETKSTKKEAAADGTLRVIRVQPQTTQADSGTSHGSAGENPGNRIVLTVCRI